MTLLLLAVWVVLNSSIDIQVLLLGVAVDAVMVAAFFGRRTMRPAKALRLFPYAVIYLLRLLAEIVKSAFGVFLLVFLKKKHVHPVLVFFEPPLATDTARVILAQSITLTPGTITVDLKGKRLCVHALDSETASGLEDSIFVKQLVRMERICNECD